MNKKDLRGMAKFINTEEHGLVMTIRDFNQLMRDYLEPVKDMGKSQIQKVMEEKRKASKSEDSYL